MDVKHKKPICGYCNGWKKNNNYVKDLYANITMNVKKINNYLGDLYAGIVVDVKTFNFYLGDLYAGIIDIKWSYGS